MQNHKETKILENIIIHLSFQNFALLKGDENTITTFNHELEEGKHNQSG